MDGFIFTKSRIKRRIEEIQIGVLILLISRLL
jgi:hypothetical protein